VKYIAYLFAFVFICAQPVLAENLPNRHFYPNSLQNAAPEATVKDQKLGVFGCYIEILNDSYSSVIVTGRYDDGVPLIPFNIYSFEYSHYIDMFYSGYCHNGMYLNIETFDGYPVFSGYVYTGSTIHIVTWYANKIKADVSLKKKVG